MAEHDSKSTGEIESTAERLRFVKERLAALNLGQLMGLKLPEDGAGVLMRVNDKKRTPSLSDIMRADEILRDNNF